ncbi:MAG: hypothetical protein N2201_02550 [candidate division WOR-3 bacterium]|nr:hypothetical protein [candidate division WOR-3 bacterium]
MSKRYFLGDLNFIIVMGNKFLTYLRLISNLYLRIKGAMQTTTLINYKELKNSPNNCMRNFVSMMLDKVAIEKGSWRYNQILGKIGNVVFYEHDKNAGTNQT